jgi:uncharacterized membrane protein (DUF2068 family)
MPDDNIARMPRLRAPITGGLLPWIIAFKAVKAVTLTALGIALLVTRRSDPLETAIHAVMTLHLPLSSRLVTRVLAFVANLTIRRQTALAITAFAYAGLMGTEGTALYLRKPWARWFTIIATSSLIPVELYEIVRRLEPARVMVLLLNVVIVVYLWRRRE